MLIRDRKFCLYLPPFISLSGAALNPSEQSHQGDRFPNMLPKVECMCIDNEPWTLLYVIEQGDEIIGQKNAGFASTFLKLFKALTFPLLCLVGASGN